MNKDLSAFEKLKRAPISAIDKLFIVIGHLLAFFHFHSTGCIALGFRTYSNNLKIRRAEKISAWREEQEDES